ncbi:MAG: class I SAM-dependent methyltransferase, partial [Leptospira sp.]|nr:class I SAM-dependent methyltransferase [Leptospira sp.]
QEEVLNPKLYRKKIISFLPEKSNLILDLGCGPGALIGDLLTKSAKVTGIDSSPRMVEDAKNQFSKNSRVKILNSFLEDLPIANGAADSVVASMVLHHISNPLLIIEESNRVLKKGGVLCIVELKKHKEEYMRDKFADLWLGFDPEVLRNWMALSGFEIKNFEEIETSTAIKILAIKAVKKGGTYVRSN